MGVISFGEQPEEDWAVARWAFRGYLEHVKEGAGDDDELAYCLEQAIALDGLHLPLTDQSVVARLNSVLARVADEVIAGKRLVRVDGRILDERSQVQFRETVGELRALIRRYVHSQPDTGSA